MDDDAQERIVAPANGKSSRHVSEFSNQTFLSNVFPLSPLGLEDTKHSGRMQT